MRQKQKKIAKNNFLMFWSITLLICHLFKSQRLAELDATPSEEKDILVCIITAIQLSCNYKGTWLVHACVNTHHLGDFLLRVQCIHVLYTI